MSKKSRNRFLRRLLSFGFASYNEYLDSELWASFKARYFEKQVNRCNLCDKVGAQLHHITYGPRARKGRTIRTVPVAKGAWTRKHHSSGGR